MGWKIEFDAPPGRRVKSRFLGITSFDSRVYWSFPLKRWVTFEEAGKIGDAAYPIGSHAPCRSYRAFLRHLRKHKELVEHGVFALALGSRWAPDEDGVGTDITATWE